MKENKNSMCWIRNRFVLPQTFTAPTHTHSFTRISRKWYVNEMARLKATGYNRGKDLRKKRNNGICKQWIGCSHYGRSRAKTCVSCAVAVAFFRIMFFMCFSFNLCVYEKLHSRSRSNECIEWTLATSHKNERERKKNSAALQYQNK